jgi:hyperosmotically inducible periplasmic protein
MRAAILFIPAALALAACDKPQTNADVAPTPPPAVQVPLAAKPIEPPPAPQPSPAAQLKAKVKSALRNSTNLDAQGVDVTAADGVVTLYGTVPAAEESRKIAAFVAQVDGVRSVVNNLVVIRGS